MLTDQERQKIYEEEKVRREARGYTPVDWLASCILGPIIVIGVIVGIVLLIFLCVAVFGQR